MKTEKIALFGGLVCLPTSMPYVFSHVCVLCQFEMKLCKTHETILRYRGVDSGSTSRVHVISLIQPGKQNKRGKQGVKVLQFVDENEKPLSVHIEI